MEAMKFVALLVVVAVAYGHPMNDLQGKNLITGVFIPSDAFKNLQDRANANIPNNNQGQNPQYQTVSTNQPQYQPVNTNQPQYLPVNTNQPQYPPTVITNQQPAQNNQQPTNNQPILVLPPLQNNQVPVLTNQPTMNSQPSVVYTQQPLTANRDPNQPNMVKTNPPNNQPNQPIMLMQQPPTSSNQPMYIQQPNPQSTPMIIATNPYNGNQMQGTWVQSPNQNQPGSTVYTLIPLNGQNNMNTNSGGSYLIPTQSGNQNPIILSTGK